MLLLCHAKVFIVIDPLAIRRLLFSHQIGYGKAFDSLFKARLLIFIDWGNLTAVVDQACWLPQLGINLC
jgi:hypothetical protein